MEESAYTDVEFDAWRTDIVTKDLASQCADMVQTIEAEILSIAGSTSLSNEERSFKLAKLSAAKEIYGEVLYICKGGKV